MPGAATPPTSPANLATAVVVDEAWVDDTRIKLDWADTLPRGLIYVYQDNAAIGSITDVAEVVLNQPAVAYSADRWYEFGCEFQWKSTAAGDQMYVAIGGFNATAQNHYAVAHAANTFQTFTAKHWSTSPTGGTANFALAVKRTAGSGTITVGGSSFGSIQHWIIDHGPI